MSRRFFIAALAITSALPVLAQGPRSFGGGPRNLDFLAGYLGLTDSQKQQAQTIFDAANTAAQTARGQLTSARDALTAAAKASQSDTQLDTLAAAVGVVEGQLTGIEAKAFAKFYGLVDCRPEDEIRSAWEPHRRRPWLRPPVNPLG